MARGPVLYHDRLATADARRAHAHGAAATPLIDLDPLQVRVLPGFTVAGRLAPYATFTLGLTGLH